MTQQPHTSRRASRSSPSQSVRGIDGHGIVASAANKHQNSTRKAPASRSPSLTHPVSETRSTTRPGRHLLQALLKYPLTTPQLLRDRRIPRATVRRHSRRGIAY
ncbi:hypothetical protein IG631_09615 [Alternaria alternata]|nr:hypothetical protein IG631_09615 [Alternaria alternata]